MNNTLIKLLTQPMFPGAYLAILRVFTGSLLVYHGVSKVFGKMGSLSAELTTRNYPMPELLAFLTSYVEFAGGIFLVVGLFTRPTAFAIVILFAIITFGFHGADPFAKQEKAMMFLALASYFFFVGPGKLSVDYFLFKKSEVLPQAESATQSPLEPETPTSTEEPTPRG